MSKKILDGAITTLFCICLIAMPNIQEQKTGESQADTRAYAEERHKTEERNTVAAGVNLVLSRQSFTTESDGKTSIEKKSHFRVAVPENHPSTRGREWIVTNEDIDIKGAEGRENDSSVGLKSAETGVSDERSVPAGLAEPVKSEEIKKAEQSQEPAGEQSAYTNRWNIVLTEEEISLLARIVWLESSGEPVTGQEAVVEVVFNRMVSDLYPNTLYDVLSQKNPVQFCSWKNRDIAKPTEKEYQSIHQVLYGNTHILRNDTLYFSTEPLTPRLDVRIGGHSFCY